MAAYEFFTATTTDLFIANIKAKAEAYGWTIDFFGTYSSHNRLHLHNADGAHFEIWWSSTAAANIIGCTGYDSGAIPTGQPNASSVKSVVANSAAMVVICKRSIVIKTFYAAYHHVTQFGYLGDKIGLWSGGIFISTSSTSYTISHNLWEKVTAASSQVWINGAWSALDSASGGGVYGVCESELYSRMPFIYSGGIIHAPILLVQVDQVTTSYLHPIGYAPDSRCFNGGNVYGQLEEITINGEVWLPINQEESGGTFLTSPNLLLRLAA